MDVSRCLPVAPPVVSVVQTQDEGNAAMQQPQMGKTLHLKNINKQSSNEGAEPLENLEVYLGLSLVVGFVFMLVIDQLSPAHSHTEQGN